MATRKAVEKVQPGALLMPWSDGIKVLIGGALTGMITIALYKLLDMYVFSPTLCSDLNIASGRCESKLYFASGVAIVVAALVALMFFVRQRVYRPLLVVILSIIALWNVPLLVGTLPLALSLVAAAIVFGFTYALFAWIVQLRNFILALVISIVGVILLRFLINS